MLGELPPKSENCQLPHATNTCPLSMRVFKYFHYIYISQFAQQTTSFATRRARNHANGAKRKRISQLEYFVESNFVGRRHKIWNFHVGLSQKEFEYWLYCYSSLAFVIPRRIYGTKRYAHLGTDTTTSFEHDFVLLLQVAQHKTPRTSTAGTTEQVFLDVNGK